jgi:GTP-binding protein
MDDIETDAGKPGVSRTQEESLKRRGPARRPVDPGAAPRARGPRRGRRSREEALPAAAPLDTDPEKDDARLPVVALVGRPNVGKSSLFNRLVGGRPALVEDEPGVTRDRRYGVTELGRARFRVVDTGGLDPRADGILGAMRAQTLRAVDEAAVLVLVIDAMAGATGLDTEVAQVLRRTGKPVLIAANKVDSQARETAAVDGYALGFDDVFPVSASHGRGVAQLIDEIMDRLEGVEPAALPRPCARGTPIRVAFVGKPNVGKSSLVNRLLGEERVLVHDQPGTTRDPIDTPFTFDGLAFVLVDTAGLRRRRTVKTLTEAVSAKMARDQVERADVVVQTIDLQDGATDEDARMASMIEESGRAHVVALNKVDLVARADVDKKVEATRERLAFVAHAPLVLVSARTGRAVAELPRVAAAAHAEWSRRVSTADLNRAFEAIVARRPPPSGPAGRFVKLYYATQISTSPPTFYVSTNQPEAVGQPYRRYLANQFRQAFGFAGSPIKLLIRGKTERSASGKTGGKSAAATKSGKSGNRS